MLNALTKLACQQYGHQAISNYKRALSGRRENLLAAAVLMFTTITPRTSTRLCTNALLPTSNMTSPIQPRKLRILALHGRRFNSPA